MNEEWNRERLFKVSRVLLLVMLLLAFGGFFCQWIYKKSAEGVIDIEHVRHTVSVMESKADKKMEDIERLLKNDRIDSLKWIPFEKLFITYLVYEKERLVFWSDNQTEPKNIKDSIWQYKLLSNVHSLVKSKQIGDYNIVSYIPLKYNYPYENKELQNDFIPSLNLIKEVDVILNAPADKFAVFSTNGEYLFTLQQPEQSIYYKEGWGVAALIFFFLSYAILFYLFSRFPLLAGKTSLSWREFLVVGTVMGVFVFLSLRFSFPTTFFQNKIFTPYQYASGVVLSTLTHLSFLTIYLFALIYLFSFHVKLEIKKNRYYILKKVLLLLLPGIAYIVVFSFLMGVVFNSSTEMNITSFKDITFVSVWNHFLFLFWGVSFMLLYVKIHRQLLKEEKLIDVVKVDLVVTLFMCMLSYFLFDKYGNMAAVAYLVLVIALYIIQITLGERKRNWFLIGCLFVFALFVTRVSVWMNSDKKFEKYRMIAENHYMNENTEEDRIAISLIDDLQSEIINDPRIEYLVQFPDSIVAANNYINSTYIQGFWNKYEMRLFGVLNGSEWDIAYKEEMENWGRKVKSTNFYSMSNPKSDMAFLGAFESVLSSKGVNYYMEFYPRRSYKSYSFPSLLIENVPSIQSQLDLSNAKYAYGELVSFSGKYSYRNDVAWIKKSKEKYFVQEYNGFNHYIFVPDMYSYYILSEETSGGFFVQLLYFFYTFIIYICTSLLVPWLSRLVNRENRITNSFSTKFLVAYVILMVLSFGSIFYLSINYMQQKYIQEQKQSLDATRNYIQMALQEKYYWQEDLDSVATTSLNLDLLDLSYIYHTDIHVYDNEGKLIGSSQPTLFSRELISKRMSPIVYFSGTESSSQYEKIGNLEYLTVYANFYNGDFLQIGYIAVPQFLSEDLIQADLESYLIVIVHVFFIFTFLSIILSLIITRQLSLPLTLLEESLRQIRLGQENKKISYKPKDEISQLVEQYNKMVDELERSAQLLAKSERESAWRTMARQVAHEINNPLTPMKLTIQHLQHIKKIDNERFEDYFDKSSETLVEQIENLSKIASTFSSFAKLPESNFRKADVAKKLRSVFVLFSNNPEKIQITYSGEETGIFAYADPEQLILVFNNLLKNALQAIPLNREGRVNVQIESTETTIIIKIKDNGKGVPDDIKEKLFVPNFTTKSTGMGLGLSICKNIIETFGGEITFDTKLNVGSEFKVLLPRLK